MHNSYEVIRSQTIFVYPCSVIRKDSRLLGPSCARKSFLYAQSEEESAIFFALVFTYKIENKSLLFSEGRGDVRKDNAYVSG